MALLEITAASKRFGATTAVDDVSLSVERGAFYALLGPSGCGKTTLLRMIAGFETPDSGRIVIDGINVTGLPPYARPVNMMFQSYALFPHMDVAGNIAFGLRQEGMDRRRIAARVAEMLALVQMSGYERRRPHELSGGQRQRVALARALARMPKLLLLDEPLAALDRKLRAETRLELTGIQERVGITFLVVTHDQEEALSMASCVAVMDRGRVVQTGAPAEIYERPASRFVADFVGEVNLFEGMLTVGLNCLALAVAGLDKPIPLPSGTELVEGAATALAVRPEKLVLSYSPPVGFAITATVSSIGYLGGGSIVHLATEQGMALKAYLPGAAAGRLGRGTPVWASWAPEAGVVLTQ
jgi:putrescine transport system ATP-binding protein